MKTEIVEKKKWSEDDVARSLRAKYPSPEYAFLTHVRNQTGYSSGKIRTADAMVINTYPSKGMAIEGFEIKVSRSDWLGELKDPDKSAEMMRYCDYWWLVVPDRDIVKDHEIPLSWGLIVVSEKKNRVIKAPTLLKPEPPSRELVSALMRNATQGFVHPDDVSEIKRLAYENAVYSMGQDFKNYETLKKRVADFEEASGLEINHGWQGSKAVGEAVKYVLSERKSIEYEIKCALSDINVVTSNLKKLQDLLIKENEKS